MPAIIKKNVVYAGGASRASSPILLLSKIGAGTHDIDTSLYNNFYIEMTISGDAGVILPFYIQNVVKGKRYRLSFSHAVYTDITFNESNIKINILFGDYESITATIYGLDSIENISPISIINSLDSTDTDKALSANMGRKLNEKIVKKNINVAIAPGYGEVISTNIARIINNTLYVEAFINITKEIPNNGSVFGFDDGNQEIVFNRRYDTCLTGVKYENNTAITITRMLALVPSVSNYFFANGISIPIGVYILETTIDLD